MARRAVKHEPLAVKHELLAVKHEPIAINIGLAVVQEAFRLVQLECPRVHHPLHALPEGSTGVTRGVVAVNTRPSAVETSLSQCHEGLIRVDVE